MSTNISEIMFELEQFGIPKAKVQDIVVRLLIAGQNTVFAELSERQVVDLSHSDLGDEGKLSGPSQSRTVVTLFRSD